MLIKITTHCSAQLKTFNKSLAKRLSDTLNRKLINKMHLRVRSSLNSLKSA